MAKSCYHAQCVITSRTSGPVATIALVSNPAKIVARNIKSTSTTSVAMPPQNAHSARPYMKQARGERQARGYSVGVHLTGEGGL